MELVTLFPYVSNFRRPAKHTKFARLGTLLGMESPQASVIKFITEFTPVSVATSIPSGMSPSAAVPGTSKNLPMFHAQGEHQAGQSRQIMSTTSNAVYW